MVVYTTRPDTTFGVTYCVMAPEHQFVKELMGRFENAQQVQNYVNETAKKSELQRTADTTKTGVELKGIKAKNPYTGALIPVFISDYVLTGYGTGPRPFRPPHPTPSRKECHNLPKRQRCRRRLDARYPTRHKKNPRQ